MEGKVVVVAGGSGGLGQRVVPTFRKAGARVITADRHPPAALVKDGTAGQVDVTDENDVRRLVEEVLRRESRIDALVNLVGGFTTGRVVETDHTVWNRMLTMNLTAAFILSKAVLPPMLERRAGRIIHIAARAAAEPFPGAAAYVVSKAGLAALIRALSLEISGSGVTVNGILPTTIDTQANRDSMPDADVSNWVKPDSIAQLIGFLLSDNAAQINGALVPIG
jgi:NAD(P)-dependent dehydrogenase (short-subunit alcohol dehydrogenase family)